jgi:hypothetical protein
MRTLIGGVALVAVMATAGLADDRRAELQASPEVAQFTSTPFVLPLLPRRYQSHCDYVRATSFAPATAAPSINSIIAPPALPVAATSASAIATPTAM